MSVTSPFIIIIGAGIVGLSLAQGLKKSGIPFVLCERDRTYNDRLQGYRLSLSPIGSEALHQCLPEELYSTFIATCGKRTKVVKILSEDLECLVDIVKDENIDADHVCRSVSRMTLRNILLTGLDEFILYDKCFSRYEESENNQITAFFEDGSSITGNVLVGADGGNSRVRRQLLPQAQRLDTGIRIIAGKVPLSPVVIKQLPESLIGGVSSIMTPRGCGMFIARQEFDSFSQSACNFIGMDNQQQSQKDFLLDNTQSYVMWALCARENRQGFPILDSNLNSDELLSIAHDTCQSWHPKFHEMMDLSEPSTLSHFKIQHALQVSPWLTRPITLSGDAIHSMPPMGGVGASVGLRDASLLCKQLQKVINSQKSLLDAVHDYETEMLEYAFSNVKDSLAIAEKFVADSFLAPFMMKNMLKIINTIPPIKKKVFANLG